MPLDQRAVTEGVCPPGAGRMPASRTRCVLIPNQVGCRLPRTRSSEQPIRVSNPVLRSESAVAYPVSRIGLDQRVVRGGVEPPQPTRLVYSQEGSPHAQPHRCPEPEEISRRRGRARIGMRGPCCLLRCGVVNQHTARQARGIASAEGVEPPGNGFGSRSASESSPMRRIDFGCTK